MIISILAPADKVDTIRAKAKEVPELDGDAKILNIPLSETGQQPATHYGCFMNISEEVFAKLKALQEFTVMESSPPALFLRKHKLKIAKEHK